jgi:thiamine pyrophosphate-dependent acetolactate synthase large subunit-like protein
MDEAMSALNRRAVVKALVEDRRGLLVVAGLGSSAYDLFAAGDHPENFYLWGAMGGAAMIGLGLALAKPQRPVLVVTGDGEQLMGMGSLATIAALGAANLSIVVIDNEHFGETGMQPSHTGLGVDLVGIAAACGFAWTCAVHSPEQLADLVGRTRQRSGCGFGLVKVGAEPEPRVLPPRDGVYLKNRFRGALGLPVN